ncbi:MAG: Sb-PDE family phosphodiesterase [Salinibacter sp.]
MKRLLPVLLAVLLALPAPLLAQHTHGGARAIQFPDVDGRKTLQVDLHTHTVFSDGSVWPDIRVQEALRDGLDAVAMTDHLEYQPHQDDIPHPDRNRSYEIARQEAEDHDLLVLNGSEITREMPPGHANAIFLKNANPLLKDDPMAVFREAKRQGAFIFWNHPMWTAQKPSGIPSLTEMHRTLIEKGMLNGIEVVNEHRHSAEAMRIALEHDLTMLGTSDVHGLIDWDYEVHNGGHRPVTLVFAEKRSKEALKSALVAGRTAVWHHNTLIGREKYLRPLLDASLSIAGARYQEDTSVLEVRIENRSDAEYVLDSRGDAPFHSRSDLVRIAPRDTTRLLVKPGERTASVPLAFEVLNAVIEPETHPTIRFDVRVPSSSEAGGEQ